MALTAESRIFVWVVQQGRSVIKLDRDMGEQVKFSLFCPDNLLSSMPSKTRHSRHSPSFDFSFPWEECPKTNKHDKPPGKAVLEDPREGITNSLLFHNKPQRSRTLSVRLEGENEPFWSLQLFHHSHGWNLSKTSQSVVVATIAVFGLPLTFWNKHSSVNKSTELK